MNRDASIQDFTPIGEIIRPQGLEGELAVSFETNNPKLIHNLKLVYLRNERGDFYPARIMSVRAEEKGNTLTFFVQFDHIADRNNAEALKKQGIFLETKNAGDFISPDDSGEEYLVDCEIIDESGDSLGLVVDVMNNPAHPILVVATTSGSLLIPCVDHYVKDVRNKNIYCQNLDQLEGL